MNANTTDKDFDKQINRALRSSAMPEPSAALDEQVLSYATQQAPRKTTPRYSFWMPATAAVCLTGVALLIALPLSPPPLQEQSSSELVYDYDADLADKRPAAAEAVVAHQQGVTEVSAPESVARSISNPKSTAPTASVNDAMLEEIVLSSAASAASPMPLELEAKLYAQLNQLAQPLEELQAATDDLEPLERQQTLPIEGDGDSELESIADGSTASGSVVAFATKPGAAALQGAQQGRAKAKTGKLPIAKAEDGSREARYQRIREQCDCNLPPDWQQAKELLERGLIVRKP